MLGGAGEHTGVLAGKGQWPPGLVALTFPEPLRCLPAQSSISAVNSAVSCYSGIACWLPAETEARRQKPVAATIVAEFEFLTQL